MSEADFSTTSAKSDSDELLTGGQLLALQLAALDVEVVFGVPGAQLDWAIDGLARSAPHIRFVHARHEQGAAYMADGYARSTGRVGVFMVVPGPGMLNATAALSTAWACSSPVVAIVGAIPTAASGRKHGVLHEIDDPGAILRLLTKWHGSATSPEEVPSLVADAFHYAQSDRPRPAAIEIPADVLALLSTATIARPRRITREAPPRDLIANAADALRIAADPVIIAGAGVVAADAQDELRHVAEMLNVPVVTTTNGRSAFNNNHPLATTNAVGREIFAHADTILAVGTRFVNIKGDIVARGAGSKLILINVDGDDLSGDRNAEIAIRCDARLGLAALASELGEPLGRPSPTERLADLRGWYSAQLRKLEPLAGFVDALRGAIPGNGFVVSDLTQVGYACNAAFPVYEPRTYLTPGWQGTLGFAFPTALGVKVAHPDRAVVAVVGDGGFGFCLNELATAAAHDIALVTVCFDDGAFGNVRRSQATKFEGRFLGTTLNNPDYVKLAEAFGVAGVRAFDADDLRIKLSDALASDRPTVITVRVGEMPSPWHLLSDQPLREPSY
jgi:acetolactate synthase-1/2/3 large subunit